MAEPIYSKILQLLVVWRNEKAISILIQNNRKLSGFRQATLIFKNTSHYSNLLADRQTNTITITVYRAISVFASCAIIDLVAVADVEALLRAVPPDRVLHEPRKGPRKSRVELPGVDLVGDGLDHVGAAAWSVAGRPIRVIGVKPVQGPGSVQEIVHEGVDRDHAAADLEPMAPGPDAPTSSWDKVIIRTLSETP